MRQQSVGRCRTISAMAAVVLLLFAARSHAALPGLDTGDLTKLVSVGEVRLSPDGRQIVYEVVTNDGPGRPSSQLWTTEVATGTSRPLFAQPRVARSPHWSPDGRWIAFFGEDEAHLSLMIVHPDGTAATALAPVSSTNHPLPLAAERISWSPAGTEIAYVSATSGPEADANGDPMVITRYLYKPTAGEGLTRFNDNRRLHIFVVNVATRMTRQITTGDYYEHSIAWAPQGDEIVFVSNRSPDPDRVFNYDVFTVNAKSGAIRRVTDTRNAEYRPVWAPDGRSLAYLGTTRPLTSSETTMEDTHVWVMDAAGGNRRDVGAALDARQGAPEWSADGRSIYFTAQERGNVRLYRVAVSGGTPERVARGASERGEIGSWTVRGTTLAFAMSTESRPSELYLQQPGAEVKRVTSLNDSLLRDRTVAPVEAFTVQSFDGTPIEAFLTLPVGLNAQSHYPLIALIHGGPHGQQGPSFNAHAQIYATHGLATLMVNYRGSTGYGQKLADAIFGDQDGGEAKDVLAGIDAALARYAWIDGARLGIEGTSYGGQLTDWLITQTDRFKAAIPTAGISNLVSFNYMAYYHDYLAVEFGTFPTEHDLMDELWKRSAIRYAARVKTPTMFCHGENDNDVPIAEAEQFYIALKDVGVETVMIRYPREGHGIRETRHVQDWIDRSLQWYGAHLMGRASR